MFQHRQTKLTKESESPLATFARVLALKGAITIASAHFLN